MNQCYTHAGATPEGAVYLIPVYNPSIVWRVADDWHDPDAYVMQWNDEVIYTYDQFDQLTDEELFYGRNEIFYCHGYEFDGVGDNITDADLEAFFRAKTWGQSQEGTAFTQAELANLAVIEQLEADRNSPYATRGYHLCDVP